MVRLIVAAIIIPPGFSTEAQAATKAGTSLTCSTTSRIVTTSKRSRRRQACSSIVTAR